MSSITTNNNESKVLLAKSAFPAALINYISGVAGGIAVVLVGHPFDTTKTRMQTAPPNYYKGVFDTITKTLKHEGPKGFFSGMSSPLFGQMFFRACSFMTFYQTVRTLSESYDLLESDKRILICSGAITGFTISFIETPIDLVKTKLQLTTFQKNPSYTTFTTCISYIWKKHYWREIYLLIVILICLIFGIIIIPN